MNVHSLIKPRKGSSGLGAGHTKQALQSWATNTIFQVIKNLFEKPKWFYPHDFFPTQTVFTHNPNQKHVDCIHRFCFLNPQIKTLKKKKKDSELKPCLCPSYTSWACLGTRPSLSPGPALPAPGGPYSSSGAAVSIPLSIR